MPPLLPYDPGSLPIEPAPGPGEKIRIEVAGLPPVKDVRQSIRNSRHPLHERFKTLRAAATAVMAGRAWTFGPVQLDLLIRAPKEEREDSLNTYLGGVMDTLDGSSGFTFTYLPIVFEDDSQVHSSRTRWEHSSEPNYVLQITFGPSATEA